MEEETIPAKLYSYGGGEEKPINLDAYLNQGGLISIKLDEDNWIELSPITAKKLIKKLNLAVGGSLTELLSPTE